MTDVVKQIRLLESQDTKVSEDARQALSLQINLGLGIPQLVAYYADHRSERALDLLCKIKEPFDKILLDTLVDTVKEKKSQETLILLGQIVQHAPSWTPKIAIHSIFKHLLDHIKKSASSAVSAPLTASDCISGLLFVSLLLPHCTSLQNAHLNAMFSTFLSCADLYRKKIREIEKKRMSLGHVERVNVSHLGFALREYFQTLYGIYPANFLHFLKSQFSGSGDLRADRRKMDPSVILQLFNGVRLHPNLVLSSKEKEISKDRWAHKEAHDFLDECRRIIIGLIPIPVTSDADRASEPDSPSAIPPSLFSQLFSHSSSSSNMAWNEAWSESETRTAMLESINTPPGSVSGTPLHKRSTVDEDAQPMVITSEERVKRRRSTGGESRGGFRMSFSNMFKRGGERRSILSPISQIEVLSPDEEDTSMINEIDPSSTEEAEEAMDCITPVDELIAQMRKESTSTQSTVRASRVQFPPPTEQERDRLRSQTTVDGSSPVYMREDYRARQERSNTEARSAATLDNVGIRTRNTPFANSDPLEQGLLQSIRMNEAVQAARAREIDGDGRGRVTSMDTDDSARSRSASFFGGPFNGSEERERTSTMDTGIMDRTEISENGDNMGADSMDGGRSRFSVTSYFTNLNRQRFVSECPTVDASQLVQFVEEQKGPAKILVRTFSCPNIPGENLELTPADQVRAQISSTTAAVNKELVPLDQFPYLKLIQPLSSTFYEQLESKLEADHEVQRGSYMNASRDFHTCLKELGLADRLPGKIYDDMTHITKDLPLDKQRDILRTRLQLVNQHLLYERSCRLLHANRNRRLFGKIKQQKVSDAEMSKLKENLYTSGIERQQLRKALSDKRRQLDQQKREHEAMKTEMTDAMKRYQKEHDDMSSQLAEMKFRAAEAEKNAALWKAQIDGFRRISDDAAENLRLCQEKLVIFQAQTAELKKAHTENQGLRDQVAVGDFRRDDDRLRSPDNDDRAMRQLQSELERVRGEREKERVVREELRERLQETESNLKHETARSSELKGYLDRSARLLREQNEAAEQKFLSLQAVTQRQEEHICSLYTQLERAQDTYTAVSSTDRNSRGGGGGDGAGGGPPVAIPMAAGSSEIRSYESSNYSEPTQSYFIRDVAPERQSRSHQPSRGDGASVYSSVEDDDNDLTMEHEP